jgi:hypothetical protein
MFVNDHADGGFITQQRVMALARSRRQGWLAEHLIRTDLLLLDELG